MVKILGEHKGLVKIYTDFNKKFEGYIIKSDDKSVFMHDIIDNKDRVLLDVFIRSIEVEEENKIVVEGGINNGDRAKAKD